MCRTCGCSNDEPATAHIHHHGDVHHHDHGQELHARAVEHTPSPNATGTIVPLEARVLDRNDGVASETRRRLRDRGVFMVNLMAAPGAGKTTLLERTLRARGSTLDLAVIEGDQATETDAERVRAAGGRAVQVNTGAGCHLDAVMVANALEALEPEDGSIVIVENVGNLVCPALFDLGETARAVVLSVTEGDDKPSKYPHMFRAADLVLLNKIDLLPYVRFDRDRCLALAREESPGHDHRAVGDAG